MKTKAMAYTTQQFTVDETGFIQIAAIKVLAAVARGVGYPGRSALEF